MKCHFSKNKISWQKIVLGCFCLYTGIVCAVAQDVLQTFEAENAKLSGSVKVKSGNDFSGGKFVGDNGVGSRILLEDVIVEKDGLYIFRTYYTCMGRRSLSVRSGYYPATICTVIEETKDWDNGPTASMECYLFLNEGENDIVITPYNGDGPNVDKFELISTGIEMPRPEPDKMAWNYDLTDDAVSIMVDNEKADVALTDNDEETVFRFDGSTTVYVQCDMPYLLTGYYLSPGLDNGIDVKKWRLECSADGQSWKVLTPVGMQEGGCGVLFSIERNVLDGEYAAAYYRLIASGGVIGEIQFFGIPYLDSSTGSQFPADLTEGVDIRACTLGNPLGEYDYGSWDERYYNLFNHDMTKKYYSDDKSTFEVDVELPGTTRLTSYTLTSCQDYPERDPKSWVVEGFDRDWEVVSEVNGFAFPVRYATMKFGVDTGNKYYRGFRLRMKQTNGADSFQLLKWQLFGEISPAGIDSTDEESMVVFTSGHELVIRTVVLGAVYQVLDVSGRTILSGRLETEEFRQTLPNGLYLVNVHTASGNRVEKVMIR